MTLAKIVAFVTYESPWFPAGGIAAVMGQLPGATKAAANLPTVVITPFHENSAKIAALPMTPIDRVELNDDGSHAAFAVLETIAAGCAWYFIRPDRLSVAASPFFAGTRHPYDVPRDTLLRDALLFGMACVQALPAIGRRQGVEIEAAEWNLIAQDWEAATALLAFQSQNSLRGRLHLTLHNSYDEFATDTDYARVMIDPGRCPGDTIVDRALSIIEQPAFTVSEQFALDFTQDVLQRDVMAPLLQKALNRFPVAGVDNGPFKAITVDAESLRGAGRGDFDSLRDWKTENRRQALAALQLHVPSESEPVWGNKERFRRDDSPWFVMAGRDDPRQKGYDVAVAAIENYLSRHHGASDCAQFLFFPIPGDEGLAGLGFLKTLADRFPEDVIVFPFIWIAGFTSALRGAAYGLMPSLYEPFGMANEFYLAGGCVGIGRATGGNIEQIVPLRATASCSRAVQIRAERYHSLSAHPTGLLFREKDGIISARPDWLGINEARYNRTGGSPSRVEQRGTIAVFREMASELRIAIEDGIRVHQQEPELYYRMLAAGVEHIQRTFSWQRAGQEYARKIG
ncbi:MAG: glycogen/starch synthase [Planctomycetes bacterium]|nr:glycogen/starch synthase [Planctomycetota bacterium]